MPWGRMSSLAVTTSRLTAPAMARNRMHEAVLKLTHTASEGAVYAWFAGRPKLGSLRKIMEPTNMITELYNRVEMCVRIRR